ncbi:hypothetical protein RMSM_05459 [Rhodopirellula maiorica SM1]|uniref:Uncharacterized protein n=1 Tax=Rhodopirellula maiorica SM1 TaxID=1265738 RepID=M5REU1_9BACT|nr:hypothetical protein [Rhodopirellula maiorica]EMI17616.1 hypothetical protein RMSM_05459 [Rhodopirellula maiorica SM1]
MKQKASKSRSTRRTSRDLKSANAIGKDKTIKRWRKLFEKKDRISRINGFQRIHAEASKIESADDALTMLRDVTNDPKTAKRLLDFGTLDQGLVERAKKQKVQNSRSGGVSAIYLIDIVGVRSDLDRKRIFEQCLKHEWTREQLQREIRDSNRAFAEKNGNDNTYAVVKPLQRAKAVRSRVDDFRARLEDVADNKFIENVASSRSSVREKAVTEYAELADLLVDVQKILGQVVENLKKAESKLKKSS